MTIVTTRVNPSNTAHQAQSLPVREYVQFDASNAEHTQAYYHFLKYNTWPKLNYRFYTNWPRISVPETCRRLMMNHHFGDSKLYEIEGRF